MENINTTVTSDSDDTSLGRLPDWLKDIGDLRDHYHGHAWGHGVMPNNYIFFVRRREGEFSPSGVTHNLHRRYEFVVNYGGSGRVCLGQSIYDFLPGQALLVSPGVFHRYYQVPFEGFHWLFFTFDLLVPHLLRGVGNSPRELIETDLSAIKTASQIYLNPHSELDIFEAALSMGRVAHSLRKRAAVPHAGKVTDAEKESCEMLRKVAHFVDEHMDSSVRIADIAGFLEVSESNLRKLFRERYGVSLGHYLRFSRLTRSVQLIDRSDLSISDIAKQCGFESIFSFSQSFSRAMGMSPSAYRRYLDDGNPPIRIQLGS